MEELINRLKYFHAARDSCLFSGVLELKLGTPHAENQVHPHIGVIIQTEVT